MKPASFDYLAPTSLEEALALLADNPDAKLIAGGQSFVPVMNFRLASPPLLIDLNRIPSLAYINSDSTGLRIGAMTRNRALETSDVVRSANPLLSAAMPWIAHVAIRNRGTMGGSLSNADPAAELPAIAMVCDAEFTLDRRTGARTVKATDFFQGLFSTALAPDEILTRIRFPAWPANRRHGFFEVSRRHGDFAIVGAAVTLDLDANGRVAAARIGVFGAADTPVLVPDAAAALIGKNSTETTEFAREAGRIARARITPRADHQASSDYRAELIETLVRRALEQALGHAHRKAA